MERHCENAAPSPTFLDGARRVSARPLPGPARPSGPRDRRAPDARLRRHGLVPHRDGGGGRRLVARTKIWKLAESLGGVESLIELPARMTHASTGTRRSPRRRTSCGCRSGIESADDLVDDLEQALVAVARRSERVARPVRSADRPPPQATGASSSPTCSRPTTAPRSSTAARPRASRPEGGPRRAWPRSSRTSATCCSPTSTSITRARRACSCGSIPGCRCTSRRSARRTWSTRRLEASARRLYGDAFDELWGELAPCRRRTSTSSATASSASTASRRPATPRTTSRFLARTARCTPAMQPACGSPASTSCPPPAARDRPRGLGADDRRDRAARAGAAGADPLRRLRRRPGAPRPAAREACRVGGAVETEHRKRSASRPARRLDEHDADRGDE